mgnify:CR=1 FL=1
MSRNQQEQLNELNAHTKIKIGVSKVHGVGIIAIRDIFEGEKVWAQKLPVVYNIKYASFGQLFPEIKKLILERNGAVINGSIFIMPDALMVDYMNHDSENPNYDPKTDTAIRKIYKGEELFENYLLMANAEKVWPDIKLWPNVSSVQQSKSLKNISVAGRVISYIKNWLKNLMLAR